jgi:trans-aconitate 2-methyltransferase
LAELNGLHTCCVHTQLKSWDFKSRSVFQSFGLVTFVEWTQFIPEPERLDFVTDVLDRYRKVTTEPGQENTFNFYQMDITLSRD